MELIPIPQKAKDQPELLADPECKELLKSMEGYYKNIGFNPPWLGYIAKRDGAFVGTVAFKGKPTDNRVEIAYATFEKYQNQGVGTEMCGELIKLALATYAEIEITARTLKEKNYSTRILEKNNFRFQGTVLDKEDGEVWEWKYQK